MKTGTKIKLAQKEVETKQQVTNKFILKQKKKQIMFVEIRLILVEKSILMEFLCVD